MFLTNFKEAIVARVAWSGRVIKDMVEGVTGGQEDLVGH